MTDLRKSTDPGAPTRSAPARSHSRARWVLALAIIAIALPLAATAGFGAPAASAEEAPSAPPSSTAATQSTQSTQATPSQTVDPSTAPAPAPAPSPTSTTPTDAPVASPSISSPSTGSLLSDSVIVTGTAEPRSDIQLSSNTQTDPLCLTTAAADGSFSCSSGSLPSGPGVVLRITQLVAGHDNQSASVSVNLLNAPTAGSGSSGGVTTGYGTVRGNGYPQATVTATAGAYSCSAIADARGGWACNLGADIPSGTLVLRASQVTSWSGGSSPSSAGVTITIDSESPQPPTITSPTTGGTVALTGALISGGGETGALVTVFAGAYAACTATVVDSLWSCTAGTVAAGTAQMSALQQDAAGNISSESTPFALTFSAASTTPTAPTGAGTGTPSGTPAPGAGSTPPTPGQTPSATGSPGVAGTPPTGSSGYGDGAAPGAGAPSTPATPTAPSSPGDSGSAAPPAAGHTPGTWAGATRYTSALQPVFGQATASNWWIALIVAMTALVLVAAPARLLANAFGSARSALASTTAASQARSALASSGAAVALRQRAERRGALTGRNRSRDEFDRVPDIAVSPRVIAVLALVASAAIGMLSGPIDNQPAYLRLFGAIIVSFTVLNLVSVVVPRVFARRALGVTITAVFAPKYLLLAAAATGVSRLFDLDPALLFGLVLAVGGAVEASRRIQGQLALVQTVSLLVLGGAAWASSGLVDASSGAFSSFVAEVLSTLTLGSFGAAAIALIPLGPLAGRALFAWSRGVWLASTVVSFTLLAAVLCSSIERAGVMPTAVPVLLAAIAFAAVSVSVWAWVRYVAPALR
ncbi:hypothetical protein [Subtercola vilae]|uniref:hypothetical protein n=1 Tax=Subtercola vilae TaxID=2056433 RepID=UPI0010AA56CE|nr:hypothetical protein [Subtercola vilae]